ncbi:ATP-binding cassette domain-containing protein, partial [Halomicroarcula sp. GCM10025817]|uniref:ATP-binding cassette domain-containing protein n=1 Tax=Halomicroarcula sp. GCM10025817 TaxID=3252672 RepID=UPI00360E9FF8
MSHAEDASDSSATSQAPDTKVRFEDIMKQFGRLVALESIDLTVRDGEILALVGDNGAGKSTLMNILCGVHEQTSGTMYYDGEPVTFSNPSEAREMGIETVYQDLALMNELDIATNVYMDQFPSRLSVGPVELIDWNETYSETAEILDYL